VPFTDSAVPEVDLAGGRIVVVPPKFSDDAGDDADDADDDADGDEGERDEGEAAS
jgi:hypothetical protein